MTEQEQLRRVVTGRGSDGRSRIVSDDTVAAGPLGIFDFWKAAGCPASLAAKSAETDGRCSNPRPVAPVSASSRSRRPIRRSPPKRPSNLPRPHSPRPAPATAAWIPGGTR